MINLNEQFSNKIKEAELYKNPFDHLYIENFFENDLYNKILKNIPKVNYFQKIIYTGTVGKNYSPERYIFSLQRNIDKLPESQQNFWNKFNETFSSVEFWRTISLKFEVTLKERFNNLTKKEMEVVGHNPTISCRTAIVKDYTKYQLGAHTDSLSKMLSFLFYLPKDNKLKDVGTSLYRPLDIIEEERLDVHFDRKETSLRFEKIKTCEFKMNSVFVFARTNYSFHGVEEVNINKSERNLLLVNFYANKAK